MDEAWYVYVVETPGGYFFWAAHLGEWVADEERATRYTDSDTAWGAALALSERDGIDARAIRETELD